MIKIVLFDFGGVLAEEGFRQGLEAIAKRNHLEPSGFFFRVIDLIHNTGYLTGKCKEADFWDTIRQATGISGSDMSLRVEILSRFILRPYMFQQVEKIKARGIKSGVLSDQTNWLEEINLQHPFYQYFDFVFNSYDLGKSKSDQTLFTDIYQRLNINPEEILFIDDNSYHILRANNCGYKTIHYVDFQDFLTNLQSHIG